MNTGQTNSTLIYVEPNPNKGFYYGYYLSIPETVETKSTLILEVNNSPRPISGFNEAVNYGKLEAYRRMTSYNLGQTTHMLSEKLGMPHLMPNLPRYEENGINVSTCYLNKRELLSMDPKLKRIDLQVIAMIDDAKQRLYEKNILIDNKVFLHGFSASSRFANRFSILHPELVKGLCTGGIGAAMVIPSNEYKGVKLPYPVGTADLKEITGEEFKDDEYKSIPQFQFMGELEQGRKDATHYEDLWKKEDAELLWELMGEQTLPTRWNNYIEVYKKLGCNNIIFKMYPNYGHTPEPAYADTIEFINMKEINSNMIHLIK